MQNHCQVCSIGLLSSLDDQAINNVEELQQAIKDALEGKWPGWRNSGSGSAQTGPTPLEDANGIINNQAKEDELQGQLKFHIMHNEAALFPFFDPLLQVLFTNVLKNVLVCFKYVLPASETP